MTLQTLLDQAVQGGVFPSVQACVLARGRPALEACAGDCGWDTQFDLASLTKILCTTSVFAALWEAGQLAPEDLLARYLPSAQASHAGVRLEDLLFHRSGLPAFRPYFASTLQSFPGLVEPGPPALLRDAARAHALRQVYATPLDHAPGSAAVYSDVGFILLGEALAKAAAMRLDDAFAALVQRPLNLGASFHRLSAGAPVGRWAATGQSRPRPPAPGQQGLWGRLPSGSSLPGEVDDDNAYVLDGVSGHAGLFASARAVAGFGQRVLEELEGARRLAAPTRWERLLTRDPLTPGSTRAMGFDTPSATGSSAGSRLGRAGPHGAVGHTGFTGTSLWIDLDRSISVALCSNRTFWGRDNLALTAFRPTFHDFIFEAVTP